MGKAILHIHTTFSDGLATTDQIMDEVEHNSDIDVIGFTDHDDVRAYFEASRWVADHPGCRVRPMWGVEITVRGFKHLLAFITEPPFPSRSVPKFLSLQEAVSRIKAMGGFIIVPHVDVFWIGMGRHRLAREYHRLGIDGVELLTPFQGSVRSVGNLARKNREMGLLEVGGSDAHHLEDLYRVIVEFPGQSVADLGRAFRERTAVPRWGWQGKPVSIQRQLRQHTRALVFHPAEQINGWVRQRVSPASGAAVPPASTT